VAFSPHKFALLHVIVTGCRRLRRFGVKSSAFGLMFVRSCVKIRQPVQRLKRGPTHFNNMMVSKMVFSSFLGKKINTVVFSINCSRTNPIVLGIGLVHDDSLTKHSFCGCLFTPRIFPTAFPVSRRSYSHR